MSPVRRRANALSASSPRDDTPSDAAPPSSPCRENPPPAVLRSVIGSKGESPLLATATVRSAAAASFASTPSRSRTSASDRAIRHRPDRSLVLQQRSRTPRRALDLPQRIAPVKSAPLADEIQRADFRQRRQFRFSAAPARAVSNLQSKKRPQPAAAARFQRHFLAQPSHIAHPQPHRESFRQSCSSVHSQSERVTSIGLHFQPVPLRILSPASPAE